MTFAPFDLTADAKELERLQLQRLATTLRTCEDRHPSYAGQIPPEVIARLEAGDAAALALLPLTTKDQFIADPEGYRLSVPATPGPDDVLWDVAYTAGTSGGQPTPLYQTAHDFRAILFAQQRMATIRGMVASDRIVNLFPLTPHPHGAWMRCNHAAAVLGASVTTAMSGSADMGFPIGRRFDEVLELVQRSEPTVLWGVPTYVRKVLAELAAQDVGLPHLRMIAVSGEPCTPVLRRDLSALAAEATAGSQVIVSDSLGASELQAGLVECRHGSGHHNPAPEFFLLESVNEAGVPVPEGEEGLLAISHLDRRGTLLVRFLVGDRVVLTRQPCPGCGRSAERIVEHRGRSGTRTKIRGNLVDLQVVAQVVEGLASGREFQVRIHGPDQTGDLDELIIVIELDQGQAGLEERIRDRIGAAVGVRPRVETVAMGSLTHGGLKVRRIIDERDGARETNKE